MVIEAIVVIVAIGVIVDIVEAALGGIAAAMERMANLNGG